MKLPAIVSRWGRACVTVCRLTTTGRGWLFPSAWTYSLGAELTLAEVSWMCVCPAAGGIQLAVLLVHSSDSLCWLFLTCMLSSRSWHGFFCLRFVIHPLQPLSVKLSHSQSLSAPSPPFGMCSRALQRGAIQVLVVRTCRAHCTEQCRQSLAYH